MKNRNGNVLQGISAQGKVSKRQKRKRQEKMWQLLTNIAIVIGGICLGVAITMILSIQLGLL